MCAQWKDAHTRTSSLITRASPHAHSTVNSTKLACSVSVDGVWNTWQSWGNCSEWCGAGVQVRNRTCDGPFYSGEECIGDSGDVRDCFLRHCPSKLIPSSIGRCTTNAIVIFIYVFGSFKIKVYAL